ncbi:hypothetical protein [Thauera sp. Sel9]|uniref:hypothetical protein n=1 Tax=Thauera sp. Sel9 TaxID=2974299 RepID=UPI0021E182C2|nr:hypothetical protein [Thauera sp. Sel9]MCV2218884.1 hypothetical protein [Thauera sp. Sel9]
MSTDNIDVDAINLKLSSAAALIDMIYTLEVTGDINSLSQHSLSGCLSEAMDLVNDSRDLLIGTTRSGSDESPH